MNLTASVRARLRSGFTLDVALLAPPGITMLFGASGSGKTTLLRSVAGLLRPDAGSITIGTRTLFSSSGAVDVPARRRRVGYVLQQLALFPHMTVADNIAYGLRDRPKDARQARTRAIADSFRISHLLARKPGDVSGGERQRTALARSLVTDPELLLLDEPLSALDYPTQSRIIEDLRDWNRSHAIPILYVTHAHRELFALGERVVVIEGGRVVVDGTPAEVLEAPAHERVAELAGFENFFGATVVAPRPDSGTMLCRLLRTGLELEAPLVRAEVGSTVRIAVRAGDILVASEEPRGLSARNVLRGLIAGLRREGPTVVADVNAGEHFVVHLTPSAVDTLRLVPGMPVWLVIKTYSLRVVS